VTKIPLPKSLKPLLGLGLKAIFTHFSVVLMRVDVYVFIIRVLLLCYLVNIVS